MADKHFQSRAAIHHPDKAVNAGDTTTSDDYFVSLKIAQDTLLDPVKRFAYERFGPDMLQWQHCSSIRDYLLVGLQSTAPVYVGSIVFFIILSTLGYLQWGRFVGQPLIQIQALRKLIFAFKTVALLESLLPLPSRVPHPDPSLLSPLPHQNHKPHSNPHHPSSPAPPLSTFNPRPQNLSHALHRSIPAQRIFPTGPFIILLFFLAERP